LTLTQWRKCKNIHNPKRIKLFVYKYKNPNEKKKKKKKSPHFILLPLCIFWRKLVSLMNNESWMKKETKRRRKKKKKKTLITYFSPLCTIFTMFGNKDNSILNVFCWFFTCGTRGTHLLCGQIISCHIHGVKTLFHTMVWI
jgi:hypothetical protein